MLRDCAIRSAQVTWAEAFRTRMRTRTRKSMKYQRRQSSASISNASQSLSLQRRLRALFRDSENHVYSNFTIRKRNIVRQCVDWKYQKPVMFEIAVVRQREPEAYAGGSPNTNCKRCESALPGFSANLESSYLLRSPWLKLKLMSLFLLMKSSFDLVDRGLPLHRPRYPDTLVLIQTWRAFFIIMKANVKLIIVLNIDVLHSFVGEYTSKITRQLTPQCKEGGSGQKESLVGVQREFLSKE